MQSGGVEIDPGLSLEVQLQAERDAIDRKEKEVRSFCLNDKCGLNYFTSITLKVSFEQKGIIVWKQSSMVLS